MKLSVSNLAWLPEEESEALTMLAAEGVDGVEIAPSLAFGGVDVRPEALRDFQRRLADHGLEARALQSILYGHPELQVFVPESQEAFLTHIARVASIAAAIGAKVLVFGSPANRRRGGIPLDEATGQASDLFRQIGDRCAGEGVSLAIEHSPTDYACDFLNSIEEVTAFLEVVNHPSIGLNVDTGGLALSTSDFVADLATVPTFLHLHLSEPHLAPVGRGQVDFAAVFRVLADRSYGGWVSIEMKRPSEGLRAVKTSVRIIRALMEGR
jgi:sugar phosphate isomerase/epimerase